MQPLKNRMSKKSKDQSTVRKEITRGRHARGIGPRPLVCTRRHLRSFAQGLVLITLSLYRSQHFALYVQGGIQDYSVEDRTPNVFQSLLNPTQLSKCSCCPIDQLTPGGLCLTPFPLNNELNPAKRGSVHLGTGFFGGIE